MFVAWRDLRFARGRFVLVGAVVALITILVGFLAGLTGGLANQNISAVLALPGDRLVLDTAEGTTPTFAQSEISATVESQWTTAPGVTRVQPVGILQSRAEGRVGTEAVALIGIGGAGGETHASRLQALAPARDDLVGLSTGAASALGVRAGDTVDIAGTAYRVARIGGDLWYSHAPVVVMTPAAWAQADTAVGGSGFPTALAVSGQADWEALAADTGTVARTPIASLSSLETFRSEIGSLALMIALLFGISALVVGAFFTVWILQRTADIAVLKALGATTRSLVRDALGQAFVVLVAGTGAGLLAVVALGAIAAPALPFLLSPLTTLLPAAGMIALGLVGAAVALRPVTSVDPLTALGSTR